MRALNAIRRALLLLLLIPVVAIALDALFVAVDAQKSNPIVRFVADVADYFIVPAFTDVFAKKQSNLQTAFVALVAYGILALIIVAVFKLLASLFSARPPKLRQDTTPASRPTPPAAPTRPPARPAVTKDSGDSSDTSGSTAPPATPPASGSTTDGAH